VFKQNEKYEVRMC